jgi:Tetratricopeptide repeat
MEFAIDQRLWRRGRLFAILGGRIDWQPERGPGALSATKSKIFAGACALFVIAVAAWLGASSPARAQDDVLDKGSLLAKKEALFAQMLRDPSNLDVTFAYADVSAQLGDNEAAVAALERMLLFNPNLPRVDLELGVLYFRMGSFEAAQSYFEKAKSFNPPPEVASRVDEYLGKISTAEQTSQVSGFVFTGAQYQSDANVAPGSPLVHSPIGDVLLSQQFVKSQDVNVFATGAVLYSYDLGTQDRDTLEASGTGFVNHYSKFNRLDLDLVETTVGPRFRFPDVPYVDGVSLKPYAILNDVGLGENQYFWTYGAGIEATGIFFGDVAAKVDWEIRHKTFANAPDRPLSYGLSGNDNIVSLQLTKPVTTNSALTLEFDYLNQATRFDYYANQNYAVSAGYKIRYEDPTGWIKLPWESAIFGSRSWALYDAPDPCCNTSGSPFFFSPSTRYDRHWRFGVTQSIQVLDNVAIVLQAQRDIVSSNLSIYAYTSNSFLVGPQFRF